MDVEKVRAALAQVELPGGGNVLEAELVRDVEVAGADVLVVLRFKGMARPVRHAVEDKVQAALEALPGVGDVTVDVEVEDDPLVDAASPRGGPAAAQAPQHGHGHGHGHAHPPGQGHGPAKRTLPGVQNLIAVASGKGGVGKSTVAVNLALALKARGARVGLLDIDIYGPSAPLLLGVADARPGVAPDQKRFLPVDAYGLRVMSIGFLVDEDTPVIWRGPIVGSVVKQFLEDVDWGELDYLCIDLPPGTGDAQLTLTQSAPLTGALIVTTPSELALIDAVKGLQMFRKVDVPVIGLVENMSHYACPSCGHESHPFNAGGTPRVAEQYGTPILARIPIDVDIQRGGDQGKPVVAEKPESPQAEAFLGLADAVMATCPFQRPDAPGAKKPGGFLSSLFRR